MAALLTRMSRRPKACSACSTACAAAPASATSATKVDTCAPGTRFAIVSVVRASASALASTSTAIPPSAQMVSPVAAPMPQPPPVISATLPSTRFILCRSDGIDRLLEPVGEVHLRPFLRLHIAVEQHAGGAHALPVGRERRRLRAVLQRGRRFVEETPGHHDRAVGRKQLLVLVVLDRSHAFLQRRILNGEAEDAAVGALLLLRTAIDEIVVVLVGQRTERAGLVGTMDAFALLHVMAFLGGQRFARMEVDTPGPAIVIVDRHPDVAAERMVAERRDQREPRKQPMRDAPVVRVGLAVADAVQRQAEQCVIWFEE